MRNRRRLHVAPLAAALALLVAGCSSTTEESPGSPPPVHVKVLITPYVSFVPFFIAQEEGYFAEQGLEVEFVLASVGWRMLPLLVQGELDVYGGNISVGLLNAMARGSRIRLVADKGHVGPPGDLYYTVVARRELVESGKLQGVEQLRGLRIERTPGATPDYLLDTLLATAGMTQADMKVQTLPNAMIEEAFRNGALDLAITPEPWATRAVRSGAAVVWKPAYEIIPGFQQAIVAFGPSLLDDHRDVGERFMVAYLKAVRRYNEGKTEKNVDVAVRVTKLDPELVRATSWPCIREDGRLGIESLRRFQEWAVAKGQLDRALADSECWEPHFAEHACRVLGGGRE